MPPHDADRLATWFSSEVRALRAQGSFREDDAHRVWSELIVDGSFKTALYKHARATARKFGVASWAEDIADEVILRLRRHMLNDPTLGFDPEKGAGFFAGWMGTILYRQAIKAALSIKQQTPEATSLHVEDDPAIEARTWDRSAELMRRLNRFPNPQKAIAHRLAKGHTLERIADDLQLAYKRVSKLAAEVRNILKAEYRNE